MKRFSIIAIIILTTITFSFAQEKEEYSKWEIYGGYSKIKSAQTEIAGTNETTNGYEVSVTRNLNRFFGLKFDHSGGFLNNNGALKSSTIGLSTKNSVYTFAGGIQIKDNSTKSRLKPFAHALFGISTAKSELNYNPCPSTFTACSIPTKSTKFAMIFGGGVDVKVNSKVSIRPIQIDYVRADHDFNAFKLKNNVRIGAGIVFTQGETEISSSSNPKNYSRYELHGGYSYAKRRNEITQTLGNLGTKGLNGYNSSIKWNFQRFLGAEFEHSTGFTATESANEATTGNVIQLKRSLYTFAGGIQVKDNSEKTRIKPFGHALFGAGIESNKTTLTQPNSSLSTINSNTGFLMIFGGGLDVKVNNKVSFRVIQVDYLRNRFSNQSNAVYYNYMRFGTGILFH